VERVSNIFDFSISNINFNDYSIILKAFPRKEQKSHFLKNLDDQVLLKIISENTNIKSNGKVLDKTIIFSGK